MKKTHRSGLLSFPGIDTNRNFGLDLMRAVAILLVLFGHGFYILPESAFKEKASYIFGIDGVEIFFVLSGFLIGQILIRIFDGHSVRFKEVFTFWYRRWFRTLPAYYLALIVHFMAAKFLLTNADQSQFNIKFVFFLQNFNWYFYGFFMESWSLSIEEWFYLTLPIAIYLISVLLDFRRGFWIAVLGIFCVAINYRLHLGSSIESIFQWDFKLRKVVLCRLDSIMIGVMLARLFISNPAFFRKYKFHMMIAGVLLLIFCNSMPGFPTSAFYKYWYLTLLPLSIALILPSLYFLPAHKGRLATMFTFISLISYSLYLFHGVVLGIVIAHFYPTSNLMALIVYGSFIFFSVLIAAVVYRFYEWPVTQLRDHVGYSIRQKVKAKAV